MAFPDTARWPEARWQNAVATSVPASTRGQRLSLAEEDVYGAEGKGVWSCLCVLSPAVRVLSFAVAKGTHK